MLRVEGVDAYYGLSHVLQGVSLTVEAGEAVALLGRNGAGKTTTLKTIMARACARAGAASRGTATDITALPPYRIVQRGHRLRARGAAHLPQSQRVREPQDGAPHRRRRPPHGRVPRARARALPARWRDRLSNKGKTLSGGEQQMLTMARSLGTDPKLLLIDEPTEGLMPAFVETIGRTITEIQRQGVAVLLVEQNTRLALEATQRVYVIEKGMIKHEARSSDLAGDAEARRRYLGV